MTCKHPHRSMCCVEGARIASVIDGTEDTLDIALALPKAFKLFCEDCFDDMPLGPANDAPEDTAVVEAMAIELKAAELAVQVAGPRVNFWRYGECLGFVSRRDGDDIDHGMMADAAANWCPADTRDWHAGWLAHVIANHNTEHVAGTYSDVAIWRLDAVPLTSAQLSEPIQWMRPQRVIFDPEFDLFDGRLSNDEVAAVFGVMAMASRHTFWVMTRLTGPMLEWFRWVDEGKLPNQAAVDCVNTADEYHMLGERIALNLVWPLPNVHLTVPMKIASLHQ